MLQANDKVRAELVEIISNLSDEKVNEPQEGKWNIKQVVEHIAFVEGACAMIIKQGIAQEAGEPAEPKPIQMVLDRTVKVDVPKGVGIEPTDQFQTIEELKNLLAGTHQTLSEVAASIDNPADLTAKSAEHPVFGSMSLQQWFESAALHEQRHLEQIKDLL